MGEGKLMEPGGANKLNQKASDTPHLEPLTPVELEEMLTLAVQINSSMDSALRLHPEPTTPEIRYLLLFRRNELYLREGLKGYCSEINKLTTKINAVILQINILSCEYPSRICQIDTIANWKLEAVDLSDLTKIQSHISKLESSLMYYTGYYYLLLWLIQGNKT